MFQSSFTSWFLMTRNRLLIMCDNTRWNRPCLYETETRPKHLVFRLRDETESFQQFHETEALDFLSETKALL